jgi:hypothetical protein
LGVAKTAPSKDMDTHIVQNPVTVPKPLAEFIAQKVVRDFADPIFRRPTTFSFHDRRTVFCEDDSSLRRHQISSKAASPTDSYSAVRTLRRSLLQHRQQQLRKQVWAQNVRYVLQLIAVRALAVCARDHDAGVIPENIEPVCSAEEVLGGGLDGGEVREVKLEEVEGPF